MSKNKVISAQIFRWLECKKYSIKVERKNGLHLYTDVSLKTAMNLYKALFRTDLHFSSSCDKRSVQGDFVRLVKHTPLKVYFVQVGMDGYMPDSTSAYPTLETAISAAHREKEISLESWDSDCEVKVTGNIRSDWRYETLIDGRYNHSIIIQAFYQHLSSECKIGEFKTRADVEKFCEWFNENN